MKFGIKAGIVRQNLLLSILLVFMLALFQQKPLAQDDTFAPQLSNDLSFAYVFDDDFAFVSNLSYNNILNKNVTWNELSLSSSLAYVLNNWIDISTGFYISRVNQSSILSNREARGILGIRFHTQMEKRIVLSNLSRLEMRGLFYSDNENDFTFRFRNMTLLFVSLIKNSMIADKNLFLISYVEFFYNFDDNTRERFFNLFKAKLGLGYRFNFPWRIDIGAVYQDTRQNVGEISNLPTNYNSEFIFEWRVSYFLSKKKDRQALKE